MKQLKFALIALVVLFGLGCKTPQAAEETPQPLITTAPVVKKLDNWQQSHFGVYNLKKMQDSTTYFYNTGGFIIETGNVGSTEITYQNGQIGNSKNGLKMTVNPQTAGKLISVEYSGNKIVKMVVSFHPEEPSVLSTFAVATNGLYYLEYMLNGKATINPNIWLKVSFNDMINVREITASGWSGFNNF